MFNILSQLLKKINIAPICIQEIIKINSIYLYFNDHSKNINQPFFQYSPLLQSYYLWKGQLLGLEWGDHVFLERTSWNKIKTNLSLKNKSDAIQNIFFLKVSQIKKRWCQTKEHLSSGQLILMSWLFLQEVGENWKIAESMMHSPFNSLRIFTITALLVSFSSQISTNRRKLPSKTRNVKESKDPPNKTMIL